MFTPDKNAFLGLLVRLALLDGSSSSTAVLQSALALSSFHHHGLRPNVFRFKARALRTLASSCAPGMGGTTVMQHMAASMILCHLEMLGMPGPVSLWFCHLIAAKQLVDNAAADTPSFPNECSPLLAWVEYHMVMGQFTVRHWYLHKEPRKGIKTTVPANQGTCQLRQVNNPSHSSHEILICLSFLFETIRQPTDDLYHDDEYEKSLHCLETRITNIVPSSPRGTSEEAMSYQDPTWAVTIELFKIAALIYLKRASRNFSGPSPEIDAIVVRAFALFDESQAFSPAFPLLVIGCEARTDEQRMRILEHIGRTKHTSGVRSLHHLQAILEQIWVQQDLAVDYELDYLSSLDAVITSYQIMPSFV